MRPLKLPAITRTTFLLLAAVWIASVPNVATLRRFWHAGAAGQGFETVAFTLGGWLFVLTVTFALLCVLAVPFRGRAVKAIGAIALVAAAALGYYTTFLGTQFDRTMVLNMVQTHTAEALELFNLRLLAFVLLVGVLPAFLFARVPLKGEARWWRGAARATLILLALVAVTAVTVYAQYSRYASAARKRDITFHTVVPANLVAAAASLAIVNYADKAVRAPRGLDARQAYAIPKSRLLILVLGETARAKNHGLNGYLRETTPRMRAARGYYFADTESCGTATAISVPCIFSGLSRQEFSLVRARERETLIDVVVRGGARVVWRDNDSGCKGVCDKSEFHDFTGSSDAKWCPEAGNCYDEILLDGLEGLIRAETRDTLVVLHLKGSHGPAYYKRYPPAFAQYEPACATDDLSSCDGASLRNAYDNTILYTDHVVGRSIDLMGKLSDQFATALLYVSDHGESLGENGLYLHGMPYAVAPLDQTRVPMYAWVSPQFVSLERWDAACMARQARVPRSHDNVYATVLGFMEIESVEYKPELDLFEPCDPSPPLTPAKR